MKEEESVGCGSSNDLQQRVLTLEGLAELQIVLNEHTLEINRGLQSQIESLKFMIDHLKREVDKLNGHNDIIEDIVLN
jgi:cell division protein FtsB